MPGRMPYPDCRRPLGPAEAALEAEQFARLGESDPAPVAVETAIHQFFARQFHDVDIAMMDRHQEPRVESLDDLAEVVVEALSDNCAAHVCASRVVWVSFMWWIPSSGLRVAVCVA